MTGLRHPVVPRGNTRLASTGPTNLENTSEDDAFGEVMPYGARRQMHEIAAVEERYDRHPVRPKVISQLLEPVVAFRRRRDPLSGMIPSGDRS
jgi:hypothetical protein